MLHSMKSGFLFGGAGLFHFSAFPKSSEK